MSAACQVPVDITNGMSTLGLLETVLEYPMLTDFLLVNLPQSFYDNFASTNNACIELINRDDATANLINRYLSMSYLCSDNNYSTPDGKGGDTSLAFLFAEVFLAQEDFLDKATGEQLLELSIHVMKTYLLKLQNERLFQYANITTSVWMAIRIMAHDDYAAFQELLDEETKVQASLQTGVALSLEQQIKVMNVFNDFIIEYYENIF